MTDRDQLDAHNASADAAQSLSGPRAALGLDKPGALGFPRPPRHKFAAGKPKERLTNDNRRGIRRGARIKAMAKGLQVRNIRKPEPVQGEPDHSEKSFGDEGHLRYYIERLGCFMEEGEGTPTPPAESDEEREIRIAPGPVKILVKDGRPVE